MPATGTELVRWVEMTLDGEVMPDTTPRWADGTLPTEAEWDAISELEHYEAGRRFSLQRQRERRPARRRASALLRRFLTPAQRRQLAQRGCFDVLAPSGTRYRFWPNRSDVSEMEQHGCRWYERASFCLHPENQTELPAADVTLAQLLVLSSSEADFLALANRTERDRGTLWSGEWQRRLNRARAMRGR